jgi:hypothetical protein
VGLLKFTVAGDACGAWTSVMADIGTAPVVETPRI